MDIRQIGQFIIQTFVLFTLHFVRRDQQIDLLLHGVTFQIGSFESLVHRFDLSRQLLVFRGGGCLETRDIRFNGSSNSLWHYGGIAFRCGGSVRISFIVGMIRDAIVWFNIGLITRTIERGMESVRRSNEWPTSDGVWWLETFRHRGWSIPRLEREWFSFVDDN